MAALQFVRKDENFKYKPADGRFRNYDEVNVAGVNTRSGLDCMYQNTWNGAGSKPISIENLTLLDSWRTIQATGPTRRC